MVDPTDKTSGSQLRELHDVKPGPAVFAMALPGGVLGTDKVKLFALSVNDAQEYPSVEYLADLYKNKPGGRIVDLKSLPESLQLRASQDEWFPKSDADQHNEKLQNFQSLLTTMREENDRKLHAVLSERSSETPKPIPDVPKPKAKPPSMAGRRRRAFSTRAPQNVHQVPLPAMTIPEAGQHRPLYTDAAVPVQSEPVSGFNANCGTPHSLNALGSYAMLNPHAISASDFAEAKLSDGAFDADQMPMLLVNDDPAQVQFQEQLVMQPFGIHNNMGDMPRAYSTGESPVWGSGTGDTRLLQSTGGTPTSGYSTGNTPQSLTPTNPYMLHIDYDMQNNHVAGGYFAGEQVNLPFRYFGQQQP